MLLLAIPMYAAPFVLISLISCAVFLAIPRLRRYALAALVAPVTFGGCAAAGFIAWIVVCNFLLKIELKPMTGLRGALDGLLFFFAPGVLGSSAFVWVANKVVRLRNIPLAPSWKDRTSTAEPAASELI